MRPACRISNNDFANGHLKYKGVQIYDLEGGLTVVLTPRESRPVNSEQSVARNGLWNKIFEYKGPEN